MSNLNSVDGFLLIPYQTGFELWLGHGGRPCPVAHTFSDQAHDMPHEGEDLHNQTQCEHHATTHPDEDADVDFGLGGHCRQDPVVDEEWEDMDTDEIPCHLRPPSHSNYITVVDVTGVHFLTINYCYCPGAGEQYMQLLNCHIFPSTLRRPKTAFTF